MSQFPEPDESNLYLMDHVRLLRSSYRRLTGKDLADPAWSALEAAERLYRAPFVLVSHGTEADPVFNYANLAAQRLYERDWAEFTSLPSRFSAEPVGRPERDRLLARVSADGYIDDYHGVRIAKSGQRFEIANVTVWNLIDDAGVYRGQGACFADWTML